MLTITWRRLYIAETSWLWLRRVLCNRTSHSSPLSSWMYTDNIYCLRYWFSHRSSYYLSIVCAIWSLIILYTLIFHEFVEIFAQERFIDCITFVFYCTLRHSGRTMNGNGNNNNNNNLICIRYNRGIIRSTHRGTYRGGRGHRGHCHRCPSHILDREHTMLQWRNLLTVCTVLNLT